MKFLIVLILIAVTLSSCSYQAPSDVKISNEKAKVIQYLSDKYRISDMTINVDLNANETVYLICDSDGVEFSVKYDDEKHVYSDDYMKIKYASELRIWMQVLVETSLSCDTCFTKQVDDDQSLSDSIFNSDIVFLNFDEVKTYAESNAELCISYEDLSSIEYDDIYRSVCNIFSHYRSQTGFNNIRIYSKKGKAYQTFSNRDSDDVIKQDCKIYADILSKNV